MAACDIPRPDLLDDRQGRIPPAVKRGPGQPRGVFIMTVLVLGLLLCGTGRVAGQSAQGSGASVSGQDNTADPEMETDQIAPVLLGGEPVVWILARVGPWTTEQRAERVTERLEAIVHDRAVQDPAVTVVDVKGSSELRIGGQLLMVVTENDAQAAGAPVPGGRDRTDDGGGRTSEGGHRGQAPRRVTVPVPADGACPRRVRTRRGRA